MDASAAFTALTAHTREIALLDGLGQLLEWDQQTVMPRAASAVRGEQLGLLSRLAHERLVDPRIGEWAEVLGDDVDPVHAAAARNVLRRHRRAARVSASLVDRIARAQAEGFDAWLDAREHADFRRFAPALQRLLDLVREKTSAIDADRSAYDVLLDEYDPGTTTADLRGLFARLRAGLVELLDAVAGAPQVPDLGDPFPVEAQRALHLELLPRLGYAMDAGRLDPAAHPFTVGIGPGDVRLTTRIEERDLLSGLGATIHEAGHGMYEQGLPAAWWGTPVGVPASFGLHESQSRFWENTIARSEAFCGWLAPLLRKHLGVRAPDARRLYEASNRVERGLIRVAADEVTYNLHVIVRFELELALLEGELAVADLPDAWADRYADVLGVRPDGVVTGVLQDVHWSGGAFGYFPSYTLGNLYAASLAHGLVRDVPDAWDQVGRGEFGAVLGWLRTHVHAKAHLHDAPDVVRAAVGERDAAADLLDHLWARHGALYGVRRS